MRCFHCGKPIGGFIVSYALDTPQGRADEREFCNFDCLRNFINNLDKAARRFRQTMLERRLMDLAE